MSMLARAPVQAPTHLTPPPHFAAISISAAAVFLTVAFLLRWKRLGRLEFLKPWLYLLAGIGFAAAFLTSWANTAMTWCRNLPYGAGAAVPVVIVIVLAYIVLYDLWPKHASNTVTEWSALLLPSFAPAMGGAAGQMLGTALSTVAVTGASIIGQAFGV
jgi:hypothetical protein